MGSELSCTPGKRGGGDPLVPLVFFFFPSFSPALYYLNGWNRLALKNIFVFYLRTKKSRPMKGDPRIQRHGLIQDSRFWFSDSFHQWNLISGFQLLVGFGIPRDVFWNPNLRIPHSTSKSFPRILIPFLGKEGFMSLLYSATYARMNFELRITDECPARSIRLLQTNRTPGHRLRDKRPSFTCGELN